MRLRPSTDSVLLLVLLAHGSFSFSPKQHRSHCFAVKREQRNRQGRFHGRITRKTFSDVAVQGRIGDASETRDSKRSSLISVIHACARSRKDPTAASKAEAAYEEMKALGLLVDSKTFTSLISTFGKQP